MSIGPFHGGPSYDRSNIRAGYSASSGEQAVFFAVIRSRT
jgi:hypothetical protein